MKIFEMPEVEVRKIMVEDIITTSLGEDDTDIN